LDGINEIASKSSLFTVMDRYYGDQQIESKTRMPETYLIPLTNDQSFEGGFKGCMARFKQAFDETGGCWIYKPGECTN
jgi:hypothetical protein